MKLYKLNCKTALCLKGKAAEFLKQYSSNTLETPRNAFVDLRGRIVAVFDQKVLADDRALVVIERQFLARLKQHLEKYLSLMDTTLDEDPRSVYFDLEGETPLQKDEILISQKKGALILTARSLSAGVSEEEFTLFRLKQGLAIQGVDFDDEMLLDVGDEEFVSYTKGCYLGQEIIARVHHRGKPPRRLVVLSEEEVPAKQGTPMTSRTQDPATGKVLGFSFVKNS